MLVNVRHVLRFSRRLAPLLAGLLLLLPAAASGHAERPSHFPDPGVGEVPDYRTTGASLVVCKSDSRRRIRRNLTGAKRKRNLRLLRRCEFEHIQAAVNAAANGTRILVLPGVYREEPSRAAPQEDPKCESMYAEIDMGSAFHSTTHEGKFRVPSYEHHRNCPNANQLIAITGDDDDPDRACDDKCGIQIEGTGRRKDVRIVGDQERQNVIKADRADGIHLRNFTIQYARENNIYVHETNGFSINRIESRWAFRYGVLTFTSDHGLYDRLETYGNGDSGVYPGSGPECKAGATGNDRYGIEIRNVDSYGNLIGYSGTAGNGIYAHDNRFHDNTTGITTDSFVPGHPGMPQDCAKFEDNEIYSNNLDLYSDERDEYCKKPEEERTPKRVCPHFSSPVSVGVLIAGGNANIVQGNYIYDNWRDGVRLFWVPAAARGEVSPTSQYDTSHDNLFAANVMGRRPVRPAQRPPRPPQGDRGRRGGRRGEPRLTGRLSFAQTRPAPNGNDFWWDEEGTGNCWRDNTGATGGEPSANFPLGCPAETPFSPTGNPQKISSQLSCASWDPEFNPNPPGCDWFTRPPPPQ